MYCLYCPCTANIVQIVECCTVECHVTWINNSVLLYVCTSVLLKANLVAILNCFIYANIIPPLCHSHFMAKSLQVYTCWRQQYEIWLKYGIHATLTEWVHCGALCWMLSTVVDWPKNQLLSLTDENPRLLCLASIFQIWSFCLVNFFILHFHHWFINEHFYGHSWANVES